MGIIFDLFSARHLFLIFGLAALAFILAILFTKPLHFFLEKFHFNKTIRETAMDGKTAEIFRKLHQWKEGTPTMGGVIIWGITLLIILLSPLFQMFAGTRFSLLNRNETYLPLFTLVVTALLGAFDDFLNIKKVGKTRGLTVSLKFLWLILFSLLGGLWFHYKLGYDAINIPGIGDITLGPWYILLFMFIIVASANAVNITDGLDGLAGGLLITAFSSLGIISYLQGLLILTAFCAIIVGATLAFLWFNIPPALFYMGDTGALALGATMGVIAMLTNSVFILPFIAFIFVIETISVIIQLLSKKFRNGKKVFIISPLHHHFEAKGWPEGKVVMRFWIIGGFMAALGIALEIMSLLNA